MSKKTEVLVSVLAILALCMSVVSLCTAFRTPVAAEAQIPDVQYVMYLGTNDKDSNKPIYPPDEAKARAEEIPLDRFGGYTIQEANGGWIDDDGTLYQEYTIVIYLSDTTAEEVHAAADTLLAAFNQSSALI